MSCFTISSQKAWKNTFVGLFSLEYLHLIFKLYFFSWKENQVKWLTTPLADSKECRLKNEIPFLEATTLNEILYIFPENFYGYVLCID